MSTTVKAAPRDASWYEHPNTHAVKVIHVDNGESFSACNRGVILDAREQYPDASKVPKGLRCNRSACLKGFESADEQSHKG